MTSRVRPNVWVPGLTPHVRHIIRTFNKRSDFKVVDFYDGLVNVYLSHATAIDLDKGTNTDGRRYPSRSELSEFLRETRDFLTERLIWINERYSATGVVLGPEPEDKFESRIVAPPHQIQALNDLLRSANTSTVNALMAVNKIKKPGPNPEPFRTLILGLNSLYIRSSSEPPNTIAIDDNNPNWSGTEFQSFTKATCLAFGIPITDTFEDKIDRAFKGLFPSS